MKLLKYIFFLFSLIICQLTFTQDYWELIETPDSSFVRSLAINNDGVIFLGMGGSGASGGIYRSFDEGQTWQYLTFKEHTCYSLEACSNGDVIAGINYGIYKSTDNGDSWYQVYEKPDTYYPIFDAGNGLVFTGGINVLHGILRSLNYGETWDTCYMFTNYGLEELRAIDVSQGGIIYAGTGNTFGPGGLYKSNNYGDTWEVLDVPALNVLGIGVHPSGDIFAGSNSTGLYRYHYNTQQWTHDLFNIGPRDFLFFGNDTIYVGCSDNPTFTPGILFSTDNGLTYNWLNSGMLGNGSSVRELLVDPSGYIYVCGGFIYRSSDPIYTNNDKYYAIQEFITQCIPNPFITKTIIYWDKTENEELVNLIVTNNTGKIVLNKQIENTGNYVFISRFLKPGILYYSIVSDNKTCSGKMVLVK